MGSGFFTCRQRWMSGGVGLFLLAVCLTVWAAMPESLTIIQLTSSSDAIPCVEGDCAYIAETHASARLEGCEVNGGVNMVFVSADFDGDGFQDLVAGQPEVNAARGQVTVYYGDSVGFSGPGSLCSELDNVITLGGKQPGDRLGASLAIGRLAGGEQDGLFIGMPGYLDGTGAVYVIEGGTRWTTVTTIDELPLKGRVVGELEGGEFGTSLGLGYFDEDPAVDMLVGAPGSGLAYVVFGGPFPEGALDPSEHDYVRLKGTGADGMGLAVASLGSFDGESLWAGALGAPDYQGGQGVVYLLEGRDRDVWLDLMSDVDAGVPNLTLTEATLIDGVYRIEGQLFEDEDASVDGLGTALSNIGDVDGDGLDDLAMGAPTAPGKANEEESAVMGVGRVYIVFGVDGFWGSVEADTLSTAELSAFFYGEFESSGFGEVLSPAGDLDGDAHAEFLIGAPFAAPSEGQGQPSGMVYLVVGRPTGGSGWLGLDSTPGLPGAAPPNLPIAGESPGDMAGGALFGRPGLDLDGDGYGDFFVAASGVSFTGVASAGRFSYFNFADFYDLDGDGQSRAQGDCDDSETAVSYDATGASEVCDDEGSAGLDNDCDGFIDGEDSSLSGGTTVYVDLDGDGYGDGYGDAAAETTLCALEEGYSLNNSDCDDDAATVRPGAEEVCDGIDNDCDGDVDEADADLTGGYTYYIDADEDHYGDSGSPLPSCEANAPVGTAVAAGDCDDADPSSYPGASEVCDTIDHDCDGDTTNGFDDDGDGYLDASECDESVTTQGLDCDDTSSSTNPGESEQAGDGIDNDCDGSLATDGTAEAVDTSLGCSMTSHGGRAGRSGRVDLAWLAIGLLGVWRVLRVGRDDGKSRSSG